MCSVTKPSPTWPIRYAKILFALMVATFLGGVAFLAWGVISGAWISLLAGALLMGAGFIGAALALLYPRMQRDFELEANARKGILRLKGRFDDDGSD